MAINLIHSFISLLSGEGSLIATLIGSFSGVFLAFLLQWAAQRYSDHKNKIRYKNIIKSEMELCINTLRQDNVQLLPTDRWASTANSGGLKLFNLENELIPLGIVYHKIQDYNSRVKEAYIGLPWKRLDYEDGKRLPIMQVRRILEDRENIQAELRKLKDAL